MTKLGEALAEIKGLADKVGEQSHPQTRRVCAEMNALLRLAEVRRLQIEYLCRGLGISGDRYVKDFEKNALVALENNE